MKTRKQHQDLQKPLLLNFIPYNLQDLSSHTINLCDLSLHLIDLLDDNTYSTTINSIDSSPRNLITSIICPVCKSPITLHKHWNCYICSCNSKKKIFDITSITSPKFIPLQQSLLNQYNQEIQKLRNSSSADPEKLYNLQRKMIP